MSNSFSFDIDKSREIRLISETVVDEWSHLSKVSVAYYSNSNKYELGVSILDTILLNIIDNFNAAIFNKASIEEIFGQNNIGYYYNIYAYNIWKGRNNDEFIDSTIHVDKFDLSLPYSIFKNKFFSLWLYNRNCEIVFEVTPNYPYFELLHEEDDGLKKFQHWLKDYEPIEIHKISVSFCEKIVNDAQILYDKSSFGSV